MYDQENNDQNPGAHHAGENELVNASTSDSAAPAKLKATAVILQCAYCRKKFDRAKTTAMPFCSPRCRQIDLGLWLNEVHSMPYEVDPGPE